MPSQPTSQPTPGSPSDGDSDTSSSSAATQPHPRPVAAASEARDWSDQGFEPNDYDERPPHWRE